MCLNEVAVTIQNSRDSKHLNNNAVAVRRKAMHASRARVCAMEAPDVLGRDSYFLVMASRPSDSYSSREQGALLA